MRPIYHIAASSLFAGGSFAATQSPALALSTLAIGFLIDGDHLLDYALYCYRERKRPNFKGFLGASYFSTPRRIYILLHSYEFVLAIWLIALSYSALSWAIWLSLSFVAHLLMDYWAYRLHPLCYFLTFRTVRGFAEDALWRNEQKRSGRAQI